MNHTKRCLLLVVAISFFVITACSNESDSSVDSNDDPLSVDEEKEPIELTMITRAGLTEEEFNDFFVEPLAEEFPHITLTRVEGQFADLLTNNEFPDIMQTSTTGIRGIQNFEVIEPLDS